MGLRAKVKADVDDFKSGFQRGWEDGDKNVPPPEKDTRRVQLTPLPWLDWILSVALEAFRVSLFGFILASPGVPFVPWGDATAIALTLVAVSAAVLTRFQRDSWLGIAGLYLVFGCVTVVAFTEVSSTSMLMAGAIVAGVVNTAISRSYLYGVVAGIAVASLLIQLLQVRPLPADELIFTGGPWTPSGAGRQGLMLAAFVFINAMLHMHKLELDKQRTRASEAEQARDAAVMSERARIARELHDVVSHHVTGMTLQAEAALATGDRDALQRVAASGRDALTELRRMLGVLRHPDNGDEEATMPATEPQPDLTELDSLARRAATGLDVTIERVGEVRPLPAGVELCAYRLVQESITNSTKHSDATHVRVTLTYADDELDIAVVDDGRALAAARVGSGGHGLVGMKERVALLDGELSTGPRADGRGYQVVARLPLQG